jgi:hypothetical protein
VVHDYTWFKFDEMCSNWAVLGSALCTNASNPLELSTLLELELDPECLPNLLSDFTLRQNGQGETRVGGLSLSKLRPISRDAAMTRE